MPCQAAKTNKSCLPKWWLDWEGVGIWMIFHTSVKKLWLPLELSFGDWEVLICLVLYRHSHCLISRRLLNLFYKIHSGILLIWLSPMLPLWVMTAGVAEMLKVHCVVKNRRPCGIQATLYVILEDSVFRRNVVHLLSSMCERYLTWHPMLLP